MDAVTRAGSHDGDHPRRGGGAATSSVRVGERSSSGRPYGGKRGRGGSNASNASGGAVGNAKASNGFSPLHERGEADGNEVMGDTEEQQDESGAAAVSHAMALDVESAWSLLQATSVGGTGPHAPNISRDVRVCMERVAGWSCVAPTSQSEQ
ncbi:MAG: hypothetical protein KIT19_07675 [Phycisphaeraceae bacterium]|nr:hypothetical protein [Phycisphaeraceae bacterium]